MFHTWFVATGADLSLLVCNLDKLHVIANAISCLQDNLPTDDEVKSIAAMVYVLGIAEFYDGVMQDPETATGVMYLRMVSIWQMAVNVLVFSTM